MAAASPKCLQTESELRDFVSFWKTTSLGLVDSRLFASFIKSHVSGSTNVPHDDLSARGTISVHCSSVFCGRLMYPFLLQRY